MNESKISIKLSTKLHSKTSHLYSKSPKPPKIFTRQRVHFNGNTASANFTALSSEGVDKVKCKFPEW